jgi:hypothetical protein
VRLVRRIAVLIAIGAASPACAGPPYQTDDPEPTDLHHWEIYNFADVDGEHGNVDLEAGFDLNYGAAKDLQLTATLPFAFTHEHDAGSHAGQGDVELAVKYRFVHSETAGVQAAIFPRLILPTAANHLGTSHVRLLLPLWGQKDLGKTSIFGGGGYEINPGKGNRDFWQAGLAVTHDMSGTLSLGGEVSWQSADAEGGSNTTGIDAGAIQKLPGPFALLLAGGPTFSNGKTGYHGYAALGLSF